MIEQLIVAILAIATPGHRISRDTATQHANIVYEVANQSGGDPFELIAIAHNESDWRPYMVSKDGKDCGITQIRTTGSRYSCQELTSNVRIAFEELTRELQGARQSCAPLTGDALTKCRLNRFNSGFKKANCAEGDKKCKDRARFVSRYWLRIACFTRAAKAGTAGDGCRRTKERDLLAVR